MTQAAADDIEYNTMGAFQNSDCNTHGYYIVKWTGNAYTLQGKYKTHAFNPPVIIPGGDIELIQENNTTNNLPLRYEGCADMKPCLLSEHNHQVILKKIEAR